MKVLLTGGAGFIGTHLAEALLKRRCEVVLFDNFRRDSLQYCPLLKESTYVKLVQGDVLDRPLLDTSMRGVDVVVHLAAIAGVSSYYTESLKTLRVNIVGTFNVIDAALAAGVNKVIDFSTSEVFGPEAHHVNEENRHKIGPVSEKRWVYAVSKLASEHITLRAAEDSKLKAATVRPFNIYGPRQTGEGAIRNFALALLKGEPLRIYGDGKDVRAWCYVSDMVDATCAIIDQASADGKAFNIGNPDHPVTTLELAQTMIRIFGSGKLEQIPAEHTPVLDRTPDISRARTLLGYGPKVSLEEGLRKAIDWYRENQV